MSQPRWASPAERQHHIEHDLRPLRDRLASFVEAHPRLRHVIAPFLTRLERGAPAVMIFSSGERMETMLRNIAGRGDPDGVQALTLIQAAIRDITQNPEGAGRFADLRRHFEPTHDEQATWLRQGLSLPNPVGLIRRILSPPGP